MDLPDDSVAQTKAIRLAGELLKDAPSWLRETNDLKVDVTDDDAIVLFTVLVTVCHSARPRESADGVQAGALGG